jgi:AraC-like DNA-binding protein
MDALKHAVRAYAASHANADGLSLASLAGLRMMCLTAPRGDLHSIYRPLICLVLQGAKRMAVGREERVFSAGESVIVSADMPVVGRIVQATAEEPYLAIAIELDVAILRDLSSQLGEVLTPRSAAIKTLFSSDTEPAVLDCATRLMSLLDRPEAAPFLRPGILRELHYWLLTGNHGPALRAIADPGSHAARLGAAIALLRTEYRSRLPLACLAETAAMSLTAFHKRFKHLTSLTPGQYQKRLRLIEARRLMVDEGSTASSAAFAVGYESVSQFTREYRRLFQAPPKQDAMRKRQVARGPVARGADGTALMA